jgi:hypothetical protein
LENAIRAHGTLSYSCPDAGVSGAKAARKNLNFCHSCAFLNINSPTGIFMDITRLGDKKYMAEIAAANKKKHADPEYISQRTVYLESLLPLIDEQIRMTASWQMPQDISPNESVAICLALNNKEVFSAAFSNPVAQFLTVQPWLQAWILRKWRMEKYIGQRVGFIE